VYALLEREAIKMKQGKKPMLPLWLSPTQIRFIPVGDEFHSDCEHLIEELNKISPYIHIRSDVDDREESVSRKIRDAEKEWIPIIVVVGEKERKEKTFTPRFRSSDIGESNKSYSLQELHDLIIKQVKGFPQQTLPLPLYLSKRPRFKG
jgi:threonyl-tRNA synthetase